MSAHLLDGQHSGTGSACGWPLAAVMLSVAVHLILLLFLPSLETPVKPLTPRIEISLLGPEPAAETETFSAEITTPEQSLPQLGDNLQQPPREESQPADRQPSKPEQPAIRPSLETERDNRPEQKLNSLAILEAVREAERPSQMPRTETGSIPRLPDAPGWLNDHVGTVRPGSDSWHLPDGSQRARIVTRSGEIFCGHNDPPPMADEFNPQFSVNVMRWRRCGRERPIPVDRTNPWLRVPAGG